MGSCPPGRENEGPRGWSQRVGRDPGLVGVRASAAGKVGEAPRGSISCVSHKRNCSLEQVRGFKREKVFIGVTG